ncbi:MAG: hypothetical protein JXR63_07820 [Spirochaetales bacterium]|nr:hypothetical protein [Spirochaetales bacterium]
MKKQIEKMKAVKWIIGIFIIVIVVLGGKYTFDIVKGSPPTTVQPVEKSSQIVVLLNSEFVAHDYDGGASLSGIFIENELSQIQVEIGLSRGFSKQYYFIEKGVLVKVRETEEVFPYVDGLGGLDYTRLELEYEVTYVINPTGLTKLEEAGEQTLGEIMTEEQKYEEFKSKFIEYRNKIEEKRNCEKETSLIN